MNNHTKARTPYTVAREHLHAFTLYTRRADTPVTRLRDLDLLAFAIERLRAEHVHEMLDDGYTWDEIGQALDMPRSTAYRRYATVT